MHIHDHGIDWVGMGGYVLSETNIATEERKEQVGNLE
jgi:hypothetical protein